MPNLIIVMLGQLYHTDPFVIKISTFILIQKLSILVIKQLHETALFFRIDN